MTQSTPERDKQKPLRFYCCDLLCVIVPLRDHTLAIIFTKAVWSHCKAALTLRESRHLMSWLKQDRCNTHTHTHVTADAINPTRPPLCLTRFKRLENAGMSSTRVVVIPRSDTIGRTKAEAFFCGAKAQEVRRQPDTLVQKSANTPADQDGVPFAKYNGCTRRDSVHWCRHVTNTNPALCESKHIVKNVTDASLCI